MRRVAVVSVAFLAVAVPAAVLAGGTTLVGTVGPAFNIDLRLADGSRVTHLDPGAYVLQVTDAGEEHNFHLTGPGVNVFTPVEGTGAFEFPVTLTDGTYRFICDIHPTQMRGAFTAGVVAPSPPPPPAPAAVKRLTGFVGTTIALRRGAARVQRTVPAGTYLVTVTDASATNNFHLSGPGVNRKTGRAARAKVTWRVAFRRGSLYTFRSDANPKLKGTFRAV